MLVFLPTGAPLVLRVAGVARTDERDIDGELSRDPEVRVLWTPPHISQRACHHTSDRVLSTSRTVHGTPLRHC